MNFENCEDKSFISGNGEEINFTTSSDGASLRLMPSIVDEMPASQNICSGQEAGSGFSSVVIKCEEPEISDFGTYNTEMDSRPQILNTVNNNEQSGLVVNIKPDPFEIESHMKQEFVSIRGMGPIDAAVKYEETKMNCLNNMFFSEEAKNINGQFDFNASNANTTLECDPLATETYVKQENEVYVVPSFSTFSNGNSTDHNNGGDRPMSVNEKQSQLNCKNKTHQCDVCNKTFNRRDTLKKHIRIHSGEKPYQCGICWRSFSNSSLLNIHKRVHTCEKPYLCDICEKAFKHASNLKKHKRTHTGEKPYLCDICNKTFSQSGEFNAHKRIHTGERPYQCDICNKSFRRSSDRDSHKRIHTGEKPYQCDFCKKTFNQSGALSAHKRIHTCEKPYICDICKRAFKLASHLKDHKRTHTGEKPYQCDNCGKCFAQRYTLTVHRRLHSAEKPYKCDICNKSFSQSPSLSTHKLKHTVEKPC